MTKILLVEDDKSLREIYGVRLFAEGYDVVSAGDGEQALALAIKEHPSLIITDVMMPKISGFDMLDILRSTTETKDIKVIVMTALGSEDNKDRGERLGADKYLIKSQVGIEDVVHVVHELLGDQPQAPTSQPTPGMPMPSSMPQPMGMQSAAPAVSPQAAPASGPAPFPGTPPAATPSFGSRAGTVSSPALPSAGMPANQQASSVQPSATPQGYSSTTADPAEPANRRTRIIEPINDPTRRVDIQALVDKELAKEGASPVPSTSEEKQVVSEQLSDFAKRGELPPVGPAPMPPVAPIIPQAPPALPSNPAPQPPQVPPVAPQQ